MSIEEIDRRVVLQQINQTQPKQGGFTRRDYKGALLQYLVASTTFADQDDIAQLRLNAEYIGSNVDA